MEKIEISSEALPLLRAGVDFQGRLMSRKSRDYAVRLKAFEKKHQMSSEEFKKRFEAGLLGDEEEWFDWLYVMEAYNATIRKQNLLESLSI